MPFVEDYFSDYQEFITKDALNVLSGKSSRNTITKNKDNNQEFFTPPSGKQEDESLGQSFEELIETWLIRKYNILLAYYTVLAPDKKLITLAENNHPYQGYTHQGIISKEWKEKEGRIFGAINSTQSIISLENLPAFYKALNQLDDKTDEVHYFQSTLIQKKIDYLDSLIILAEEILFFLFLWRYKSCKCTEKSIPIELKREVPKGSKTLFNFNQIIKFACALEAELYKDDNGPVTQIVNEGKPGQITFKSYGWGKESSEYKLRKVVDYCIKKNNREFSERIWSDGLCNLFDDILNNYNTPDFIAENVRFDVQTVWDVWQQTPIDYMWDILIFPVYEHNPANLNNKNHELTNAHRHPVLFHSFVKPVYIISGHKQTDESVDTLFGFHLTKEVAKHFSRAVIDDVFIRRLVQHETLPMARKNAISSVMARNMSHNIGSHVLAKMTTKDSVDNGFLSNQVSEKDSQRWQEENYTPISGLTTVDSKNTAIANFNSYIRDRMDFLADLSTGTPLMEVTKFLLVDVIAGLDGNRILMNQISGVSSFRYELEVRDCRKCSLDGKSSEGGICGPITKNGNRDVPVSIPNDVMGFHAFYIIVENVIRNTAKHGSNSNKTNSDLQKFTIEIRECKEDSALYEIWLYDNYKNKGGKHDVDYVKKLVERQNNKIDEPILDPKTNELRHGAWGLLEMKVAAAYLRKIPVEDIDLLQYSSVKNTDIETNPYILKAVNKKGCLGYVFHVLKPKELIIVDEQGGLYNKLNEGSHLRELKDHGIWVMNDINKNKDQFKTKDVYSHPLMLVIPKGTFKTEKFLKKDGLFKGNLPTRILVQGQKPKGSKNRWIAWTNSINIPFDKDRGFSVSAKEIIQSCWKAWLKHKLDFLDLKGKIGSKEINGHLSPPVYLNSFYGFLGKSRENRPKNESIEFNVFLEHHGTLIHKLYDSNEQKFLCQHFEAYPSSVEPFLDKAGDLFTENALLIDGVLTNIVIIDERVQALYQENYKPQTDPSQKTTPFKNNQVRMAGANIHIPDASGERAAIDLNQVHYGDKAKDKIVKCVKRIIEKSTLKKGVDFIIIHLGVIEKVLLGLDEEKSEQDVRGFVRELMQEFEGTRVVITSGRGKPDNLPEEIPFLSYSALSHYAIETPFKAFLNQAIQSARIFKIK